MLPNRQALLNTIEVPSFKHNDGRKFNRIKVRRFCIDDPVEKQAYEELLIRMLEGEVSVLKEEDVFSQKSDRYYVYVKWGEKI